MPLSRHPGLSEEDVEAAEVLDVLRNSHGQVEQLKKGEKKTYDIKTQYSVQQTQYSLLDRVRRNSVISNVVSLYEMNSKKRAASAISINEHEGEDDDTNINLTQSGTDDCNAYDEHDEEPTRESAISKRQKITKAIAKSKGNLKEYQLHMSIESKKRLIACLHLLKLANKQLTNRVSFLQQQVERERRNKRVTKRIYTEEATSQVSHSDADDTEEDVGVEVSDEDINESDEEFFDASESIDEQSTVIKMEVVGTVKKVYSLISKFAGNSLPEPARSQVRQTLLNLPTNWTISVNKSSLSPKTHRRKRHLSANGKVLILAEESLNVVRNVMNVVDCTLGKAEEWVKQKQEVKELLKERFIHQQLKKQIREQLEKERHDEENQ